MAAYQVELVRSNITPEERRARLAEAYRLILSWGNESAAGNPDQETPAATTRPPKGRLVEEYTR